jgi:hypothetical protein
MPARSKLVQFRKHEGFRIRHHFLDDDAANAGYGPQPPVRGGDVRKLGH